MDATTIPGPGDLLVEVDVAAMTVHISSQDERILAAAADLVDFCTRALFDKATPSPEVEEAMILHAQGQGHPYAIHIEVRDQNSIDVQVVGEGVEKGTMGCFLLHSRRAIAGQVERG